MLANYYIIVVIEQMGRFIEYIGLSMVVVFVFISLWNTIFTKLGMEHVRQHLARRVIFALEFVIAADILLAAVATDFQQILQLGAIVVIRVILGYSLQKDVQFK